MLDTIFRSRSRSALRAVVTAAALLVPGAAVATAQSDPTVINTRLDGSGSSGATTALDFLLTQFGPITGGQTPPSGPAEPFEGDCPPLGTIVEDAEHSVGFSIEVDADANTGASSIAFDAEFCMIVSTDPCMIQCFELHLRWSGVSFASIASVFVPPPPAPPPPPLPSTGFSTMTTDHGNGCIEVQLVLYGGRVYTGAEFAVEFPQLVSALLAFLQSFRHGATPPIDASCVTWTHP